MTINQILEPRPRPGSVECLPKPDRARTGGRGVAHRHPRRLRPIRARRRSDRTPPPPDLHRVRRRDRLLASAQGGVDTREGARKRCPPVVVRRRRSPSRPRRRVPRLRLSARPQTGRTSDGPHLRRERHRRPSPARRAVDAGGSRTRVVLARPVVPERDRVRLANGSAPGTRGTTPGRYRISSNRCALVGVHADDLLGERGVHVDALAARLGMRPDDRMLGVRDTAAFGDARLVGRRPPRISGDGSCAKSWRATRPSTLVLDALSESPSYAAYMSANSVSPPTAGIRSAQDRPERRFEPPGHVANASVFSNRW